MSRTAVTPTNTNLAFVATDSPQPKGGGLVSHGDITTSSTNLVDHSLPNGRGLNAAYIGGMILVGFTLQEYPANAAKATLAWDNNPVSWSQYGYNTSNNGWTNIELRLWAGSTSNHFDRYLRIPSSAMTNAQVLGLQPGTRTYFTLTAVVVANSVQSDHSNITHYDAPSSEVPTPIRRDGSTPTIDFSQMTPGDLSFYTTTSTNANPSTTNIIAPSTVSMAFNAGGQPEVSVSGPSGQTVTIQRSPDLTSWENISSGAIPSPTDVPQGFLPAYIFVDTDPRANRTNAVRQFYRAVSP